MSERMRSISPGSLSFCAAASVGSHTAPLSASTQRNVVAASRMSQPAELAQSCRRSQPMAALCGSSSLARAASVERGLARRRIRASFGAGRDEAQRRRGRDRSRIAAAGQGLRAASARQAEILARARRLAHSGEPTAPTARAECIPISASACKPRLIMANQGAQRV